MRVLLDTCVLSEVRRPKGDPGVRRAVSELDEHNLFVSVLWVGEIAKGIALLPESPRRRALRTWLETLERFYGDRLLPVDPETSRIWGGTHGRRQERRKDSAGQRWAHRRHCPQARTTRHDEKYRRFRIDGRTAVESVRRERANACATLI